MIWLYHPPMLAMFKGWSVAALLALCLASTANVVSSAEPGGSSVQQVIAQATESEEAVLAASTTEGAVRLGLEPARIPLGPHTLSDILNGVRATGSAAHVYLVLDDVQAQAAPGLPFEVFLGVAKDHRASAPAQEKVGDIFLYDPKPVDRSFDVTAALKALFGAAPPDALLAVTIQPPAAASASSDGQSDLARDLEKAQVTLAGARLVAQ